MERGNIERGKILAVNESGYSVASLDRVGIEIPDLKPLLEAEKYTVGQMVYFFSFSDGDGRIVCSL